MSLSTDCDRDFYDWIAKNVALLRAGRLGEFARFQNPSQDFTQAPIAPRRLPQEIAP